MAFSFRAKRESEVDLIEITPKAFLGISIPIAKKLGWEVNSISSDEISFATPFFFPTGGEVVFIHIENDKKANLISKNVAGIFPFELGRNAENLKQFLEGYAKIFNLTQVELYEQRFDEALELWKGKKE